MANMEAESETVCTEFFNIPREMRDEIYSHLSKDILIPDAMAVGTKRVQVLVKKGPIPKLARVNKQFKEEYEELNKSMQVLVFKDSGQMLQVPPLPFTAKQICAFPLVEFELLCMCDPKDCTNASCMLSQDISGHLEWIADTRKDLPAGVEAVARLYVNWISERKPTWPDWGHRANMSEQMDRMIEMEGLTRLEVYPWYDLDGLGEMANRRRIYEKHEDIVALWTKKRGWITFEDQEGT